MSTEVSTQSALQEILHTPVQAVSMEATVTIVTTAATYVCTAQLKVLSRHLHQREEKLRPDTATWTQAKMEVGPSKPDKLVT